ncbi:hypothetical protein LBMAG56_40440 [Verrucomicrobiota bacterium]|nr:hypothetical protein LBMAG56_40440 [Verrucomicrobiota bacterium]
MDMHIEGAVPRFGREFEESAIHRSASGVNEHIHAAQTPGGLLDNARAISRFGAVGEEQFGAAPERLNRTQGLPRIVVLVAADKGDVRAFARQGEGGRRADAAGAAGDERRFSSELHGMNVGELGLLISRRCMTRC